MTSFKEHPYKNKVILITGAAGILGSSLAQELANFKSNIILTDFNKDKLYEVAQTLKLKNKNVYSIHLDLSSKNAIDYLMKNVLSKFEKIDSAVHCQYPKSSGFGDSFEDLKEENLFKDLNMQLGITILLSQSLMKQFITQGFGNLIHISSIQGVQSPKFDHYRDTKMYSPIEYSAIKAGIISLTKWLAKYHKNQNIRVNCVSPGGIMNGQPEKFLKRYREDCTNIGMLSPLDISKAILFLLSPEAKAINGHNLIVDDGWTL